MADEYVIKVDGRAKCAYCGCIYNSSTGNAVPGELGRRLNADKDRKWSHGACKPCAEAALREIEEYEVV